MHVWWLRWWLLLQDMAALRRACEGVDVVVHCAGYGAPAHLSAAHSAEQFYASLLRTGVLAAYNVYHAAAEAGCARVVYASSAHAVGGCVYGGAGTRQGVMSEADRPAAVRRVRAMTVSVTANPAQLTTALHPTDTHAPPISLRWGRWGSGWCRCTRISSSTTSASSE
jgi:hypothetical protein